jgi:hypothetical protein
LNGGLQRRAQAAALRLQVDERNRLAHGSPVRKSRALVCVIYPPTDTRNIAK